MLREKILNRQPGILMYGITPPKENNTLEKVKEIAQKQVDRIKNIDIDGLIIYDIQDETDRIEEQRPFPFLRTIDPFVYSNKYLKDLNIPQIIYRCVGKYTKAQLSDWIGENLEQEIFSVFVGASSNSQKVKLKLSEAYKLAEKFDRNLILGGVVIPERHEKHSDEHIRIINKLKQGCKFFVTQAVYNIDFSKNILSDYFYYCQNNNIEMVPIVINLTPCGSIKTLEFMKWLGLSIPKWLENDLLNSKDILEQSVKLSKRIFEELLDFGIEKGIPIGCSVESVSTRKVEIEASIELVKDIKCIIDKKLYK